MKVNLFFNHYQSDSRQHEIDECLKKNKEVFDRVAVVSGRPTFKQLFALSEKFPNDINCFCNSDIYFKETELLKSIKENDAYALTRWDQKHEGLTFFNRRDSQDAWVFKGVVKPMNVNFYPGMWGCDNRLAYEILRVGYKLTNPSLSIITIHLHESDERNQARTKQNTVPQPYYLLDPCVLS
jgi:hypothetical protein